MSREILVVTPENVEIEYELAGAGSRLLANTLDNLYQVGMLVILGIVLWIIESVLSAANIAFLSRIVDAVRGVATAGLLIALFLVMWGYFIWFETKWSGQTPGKRTYGLRVIRDGGYPVEFYSVVVRNLLRVIDGFPILNIGLMLAGYSMKRSDLAALGAAAIPITLGFVMFSGRYQRLGDIIAGTMVVKQRAPRVPTLEALAPPPRVLPEHLTAYALADIGRHVYEMTIPEYRAVRHAIDRRWQLPAPLQQAAAMRLAVPLMQRLGITPPPGVSQVNYADLLEYLAVAFEQYRGVK